MKRCVMYARVSTDDRGQDPEVQLGPLREYAARRGFEVVGEFVDRASGRRRDRVQYQAMLSVARGGGAEVVLVWRYDRFARSLQELVNALAEFRTLGVDFVSCQEQLDTTTPQGVLIFGIMASLAEFESQLIGARVRAGMVRAAALGRHVGRPGMDAAVLSRIRDGLAKGRGVREVAREVGVSHTTVARCRTRFAPVFSGS